MPLPGVAPLTSSDRRADQANSSFHFWLQLWVVVEVHALEGV